MKTIEYPLEIDVESVKSLQDDNSEFLFIDCREPAEFEIAKIPGTTPIPMNDTPERLEELESHRDKRIIVHCHHGGRSLRVTEYLRNQGFNKTQNMTGGIDAWSQIIDPSVPRY